MNNSHIPALSVRPDLIFTYFSQISVIVSICLWLLLQRLILSIKFWSEIYLYMFNLVQSYIPPRYISFLFSRIIEAFSTFQLQPTSYTLVYSLYVSKSNLGASSPIFHLLGDISPYNKIRCHAKRKQSLMQLGWHGF